MAIKPNAHVDKRHEMLVSKPVENRATPVIISASKDKVTIAQPIQDALTSDAVLNRDNRGVARNSPKMPRADVNLGEVLLGVLRKTSPDSRKIAPFQRIRIHDYDVSHAEASKLLENRRSRSASSGNSDPQASQTL
jgi:hypothetical protein